MFYIPCAYSEGSTSRYPVLRGVAVLAVLVELSLCLSLYLLRDALHI